MPTWAARAATLFRVWAGRLGRLGLVAVASWALAVVGTTAALVLVPVGIVFLPVGVGAPVLSAWRWAIHGVAAAERALARDLLGADTPPLEPVELGPPDPRRFRGGVRRRRQLLDSERLWRETGYQALGVAAMLLPAAVALLGAVVPAVALGLLLSEAASGWGTPKKQILGLIFVGLGAVMVPLSDETATATRRFSEWGLGPSARHRLEARIATVERTRHIAVAAAEDERRRLERNLHDGAQAGMVAVAVQLGLVSDAIQTRGAGPAEAVAMIEEARRLTLGAVEQMRGLARGLHPGVLSSRGLAAALAGLAAESPLPVGVSADDDLGVLAPEVEAAAYYCAAEALANVYKHACATAAHVEIRRDDGVLTVSVVDDGVGGATVRAGGGLDGLADRLAALDGRLEVVDSRPRGTAVRVTLPVRHSGTDRMGGLVR